VIHEEMYVNDDLQAVRSSIFLSKFLIETIVYSWNSYPRTLCCASVKCSAVDNVLS